MCMLRVSSPDLVTCKWKKEKKERRKKGGRNKHHWLWIIVEPKYIHKIHIYTHQLPTYSHVFVYVVKANVKENSVFFILTYAVARETSSYGILSMSKYRFSCPCRVSTRVFNLLSTHTCRTFTLHTAQCLLCILTGVNCIKPTHTAWWVAGLV